MLKTLRRKEFFLTGIKVVLFDCNLSQPVIEDISIILVGSDTEKASFSLRTLSSLHKDMITAISR
jgi:hypothetical protein